ncbi:eukaryotic translation initiation factor 4E type 2 isoform X1 [Drosophila navojoa]|uniref:eukaryotic translation initiation factor 4E type 2 isoform X1 n=1 Tax=Drosophila navojoa TaxID=7232 RepID=UPI0008464B85|nr:eukaryotic translation initiation factor 4E type 2 isoform X1 [Drosophila navojoa]
MEKVASKQYESKIWPDLVDSDDSDVENEIDVDKLPPLEVGPNENRLQHTYCLWFSRKGTQRAATDYSKSLHVVGRCASVQQWWSLYSHLIRPTALKPYRELSLFKQGIKPMWEDPANSKGGQWVIRLRKNKIERAWENVCMAMLGEQFLVGDEICGIVLQTKYPEDSLSVWNRTATDMTSTTRIRDTLRRILNIPLTTAMEYKIHCDSLKYVSMPHSRCRMLNSSLYNRNFRHIRHVRSWHR